MRYRAQANTRKTARHVGGVAVALLLRAGGLAGAPVYGRGLPGLGGMLDLEALAPRSSPNEYLVAPADAAPGFVDDSKREVARVYPIGKKPPVRALEMRVFSERESGEGRSGFLSSLKNI